MGEAPTWYPLIKAAQYLGVAPWELMDRSAAWVHIALTALDAEHRADQIRSKQ